jgi:rhamnosyltransferase
MVARELGEWFAGFAAAGRPRVDCLTAAERGIPARALLGPRGFFTDANGCVARAAWEAVPFRPVPYAEDHVLALDMLRAGYAKVYTPDAAVIHSHEYSALGWLKRSFDESRALREVYGYVEPLEARRTALKVWGLVGADWRFARAAGGAQSHPLAVLASSAAHHSLRVAGAVLGSRAGRLPPWLVRRISLEGSAPATSHEMPRSGR